MDTAEQGRGDRQEPVPPRVPEDETDACRLIWPASRTLACMRPRRWTSHDTPCTAPEKLHTSSTGKSFRDTILVLIVADAGRAFRAITAINRIYMQESCHANTRSMLFTNAYLVQRGFAAQSCRGIMEFSGFPSETSLELILHLEAGTFMPDIRHHQLPRASFPHRTTSEHTAEYFHDAQHQISYTRHSQIHNATFYPRSHRVSSSPIPPTPTIVVAHIHAPCRSTRARIAIMGRHRLGDIVRQLLGHSPESRCVASIRRRGVWRDINFEVNIGGSEDEVEIKIVSTVEERRERFPRLEWGLF